MVLSVLSLGAFGFSMYVSTTKSYAWQAVMSLLFALQLLMDMVVMENVTCFCVHIGAPYVCRKDIELAFKTVVDMASYLCKEKRTKWLTHAMPSLDAPRYFFPSVQLAAHYPCLIESALIHSYHTYMLPTSVTTGWASLVPTVPAPVAGKHSVWNSIHAMCSQCIAVCLKLFVRMPIRIAKLCVQCFLVLVVLTLTLTLEQDISRILISTCVGGICLCLLGLTVFYHARIYMKHRNTTVIAEEIFEIEGNMGGGGGTDSPSKSNKHVSRVYPSDFMTSSPKQQVAVLNRSQDARSGVFPFTGQDEEDDISVQTRHSVNYNHTSSLKRGGGGEGGLGSSSVFPHPSHDLQSISSLVSRPNEHKDDNHSISTEGTQFDPFEGTDLNFAAFELEMEEAVGRLELEAEEASIMNISRFTSTIMEDLHGEIRHATHAQRRLSDMSMSVLTIPEEPEPVKNSGVYRSYDSPQVAMPPSVRKTSTDTGQSGKVPISLSQSQSHRQRAESESFALIPSSSQNIPTRQRTTSIPPWMQSQPVLDFDFDREVEVAIAKLERNGMSDSKPS